MQTSLPAVTVLEPIVAMALGLTIYQETLKVGGPGDLLLIAVVAGMGASTVALGRLASPAPATPASATPWVSMAPDIVRRFPRIDHDSSSRERS